MNQEMDILLAPITLPLNPNARWVNTDVQPQALETNATNVQPVGSNHPLVKHHALNAVLVLIKTTPAKRSVQYVLLVNMEGVQLMGKELIAANAQLDGINRPLNKQHVMNVQQVFTKTNKVNQIAKTVCPVFFLLPQQPLLVPIVKLANFNRHRPVKIAQNQTLALLLPTTTQQLNHPAQLANMDVQQQEKELIAVTAQMDGVNLLSNKQSV